MSDLLQQILSRDVHPADAPRVDAPAALPTLDEFADRYVRFLLEKTYHNISRTARILGISRTALYARMRRMSC